MSWQLETATSISLEKDDVESFFSLDEEAVPSSIAVLEVLTDSDSSFSESESDTCYMAPEDIEEINLVNSVPHVPVLVYTSKYAKPIKVIAFLDTRAAQTIMNPEILPQKCWTPFTKHFNIASSEMFSTHLISKPIKIQFFPACFLVTRGYTHLHFDTIRLALSYHGRKGLLVVACMALLDTRSATLTTLKVRLHITGAPQVQDSVAATFHHQMAYRVHNHALDLWLLGSEEALIISVDSMNTPTYVHVPRQIFKADLVKLLLENWITNHEGLH
ncbi:hypothetical protein CDL15_Pgr004334 [Punica granatum]|uniref:Uncharacterized protein n=1 Tax=Punica granatum TaxID=22663 RepID=A0A218XG47_PUNGR|nr:hypothetical protein CDL15_Pgr004334 [Punica granatum]PKI54751.1 hypothetical protein CRG98_024853 [Punica granatum]